MQRQEKARISVILTCCANEIKLNPYIIFKGAKNDLIYKNLIKENYIKEKKTEIYVNSNTWVIIEIINATMNNSFKISKFL